MKAWKVELTAGGKSLAEAKVQRGIFQVGTLSLLLFIIDMIPLKPHPQKDVSSLCNG